MEEINCFCEVNARKIVIGREFTYYICDNNICNFEYPLCYCKKISLLKNGKESSTHYCCKENNCDFVIACCQCGNISSIRIAKTDKNPGVIFWSCEKFPDSNRCRAFIPIEPFLKKHYSHIEYFNFVCNLWKYLTDQKFVETVTSYFIIKNYPPNERVKDYINDEELYNKIFSAFSKYNVFDDLSTNNVSSSNPATPKKQNFSTHEHQQVFLIEPSNISNPTTPTGSSRRNYKNTNEEYDNAEEIFKRRLKRNIDELSIEAAESVKKLCREETKRYYEEFKSDISNEITKAKEIINNEIEKSKEEFTENIKKQSEHNFNNFKAVLEYVRNNEIGKEISINEKMDKLSDKVNKIEGLIERLTIDSSSTRITRSMVKK